MELKPDYSPHGRRPHISLFKCVAYSYDIVVQQAHLTRRQKRRGGFTLVEILLVVAALGALATAGYYVVTPMQQTSRVSKLESDVASLNSSVQLYLANGGNLAGETDANAVLNKMKTRMDANSFDAAMGLTSSFIDQRIKAEPMTAQEAAGGELRAKWDPAKMRFVLSSEGAGVREFVLDEILTETPPSTEVREQTLAGATETEWVWDFEDRTHLVAVNGSIPSANASVADPSLPVLIPPSEPAFSLPGGALVGSAYLYNNAQFVGNLVIASPPAGQGMANIYFYSETRIKGNLYLPGLPDLWINWVGGPKWSLANDSAFAPHILGGQFDELGRAVVPPTEGAYPRVKDLDGATTPKYDIVFYGSSKIEGKVFRRYDHAEFPVVEAPPPKDNAANTTANYDGYNTPPATVSASNYANVNLNSNNLQTRLLPGNYGTVRAYNNSVITLGNPDKPDEVTYYSFDAIHLASGASIQIVGKVVITMREGTLKIDGDVSVGNLAHPEWLTVQFYNSSPPSEWNNQFEATGNAKFYGIVVAPQGTVAMHGSSTFQGAVTAKKLNITSTGVMFTLPAIAAETGS